MPLRPHMTADAKDQARQLRALHRSGEGVPALVATFGVSRATVYRLLAGKAATTAVLAGQDAARLVPMIAS